jgi:hypothetical protein
MTAPTGSNPQFKIVTKNGQGFIIGMPGGIPSSKQKDGASYAVHENGTENTRRWESLMRPQYDLLKSRECITMPESARLLNQFAEYALAAMRRAVE